MNHTKFGDYLLNQSLRITELLNMSELSSSALTFAEEYIWGEKTVRFQLLRVYSLKNLSKCRFHN